MTAEQRDDLLRALTFQPRLRDVEGENAERAPRAPPGASKDEFMPWKREQPWYKRNDLRAGDGKQDEEAV
jgi:hypothetical protein